MLFVAVNSQMLGLARLAYSLATNRQIPSAMGRLSAQRGNTVRGDRDCHRARIRPVGPTRHRVSRRHVRFGAMIAFAIAHLSLIVLRFREPSRASAFRVPFGVTVRGVPSCRCRRFGWCCRWGCGSAWSRCTRARASPGGSGWSPGSCCTSSTGAPASCCVSASRFRRRRSRSAMRPSTAASSYPCSARRSTTRRGHAGRLAAEQDEDGEGGAVLEALYVFEIPMSLPIDARVDDERVRKAKSVLARAKEVGEEYEGVEVATAMVRGRTRGRRSCPRPVGAGSRRSCSPPRSPRGVRGGAIMGARAGARPLRRRHHPLRGRQGPLQGDPHRPAGRGGGLARVCCRKVRSECSC